MRSQIVSGNQVNPTPLNGGETPNVEDSSFHLTKGGER